MRTQLSLLALVVAILAGQASSVSVSPLREYYESIGKQLNSIEKLSSEEVVSRLRGGGYNPTEVEKFLYSADDKSVEICNAHTIGELLALNEVDENVKDDCTTEALNKRAKYCVELELEAAIAINDNKADFACRNAERFCDKNLEGVKKYCKERREMQGAPIDPADAMSVLGSEELPLDRISYYVDSPKYNDVVVCNGFNLNEIYEGINIGNEDCGTESLKKHFNLCESLKRDNDLACYNARYLCRSSLRLNINYCMVDVTNSYRTDKYDRFTIRDIAKAYHYEYLVDYDERLRTEFREGMTPLEEVIAKF